MTELSLSLSLCMRVVAQLRKKLEQVTEAGLAAKRAWEEQEHKLRSDASAAQSAHQAAVLKLQIECDALKQQVAEALSMLALSKSAITVSDNAKTDAENRHARLQAGTCGALVVAV